MFRSNQRGFNLLELIVTMGILALMTAILIPAYQSWLDVYRLKSSARGLAGHLEMARSEALSKQKNCAVSFQAKVNGVQYDYIVYLDNSGDYQYDSGETLLTTVTFSDLPGISLKSNDISWDNNDANEPSVAFDRQGLPRVKGGGFGDGTAVLKNSRGSKKTVNVTAVGNIRIN